jgi:hypothetical protein
MGKLTKKERASIARALTALPASFNKPGAGLNAACSVLHERGIELADAPTLDERSPTTRTYRLGIARTNTADPFAPEAIEAAFLVLSVYWHAHADTYEVLAYVS